MGQGSLRAAAGRDLSVSIEIISSEVMAVLWDSV